MGRGLCHVVTEGGGGRVGGGNLTMVLRQVGKCDAAYFHIVMYHKSVLV